MTAKEALRSLDAFFLNAAFQCGDMMDDGLADEPDYPDESVRDADRKEQKPKKELTPHGEDYEHLIKIFCGDTKLATYWWKKTHE